MKWLGFASAAVLTLAAMLGCGPSGPAGAQDDAVGGLEGTDLDAVVLDAGTQGLPALLACLHDAQMPLVSAHRGGPAPGYPENALTSFERISSVMPALLEVDVRPTADGVFVLLHDRSLDRTTSCLGELSETMMRSVRGCALRDDDGVVVDDHVPTLAEALAWADGRAVLQLDVKRREDFPAVVEMVKQADAFGRVIFITYGVDTALAVADLHPETVISTTVRELVDLDALDAAGLVEAGRIIAWVGFGEEKPELVAALDARGVMANFGTLGFGDSIDDQIAASGDEARYARIAATGVDIFATDRPVAAYAALSAGRDLAALVDGCS